MSTFCLVHGDLLGAWCWDLVIPELEARGHRVITLDLPLEDPNADTVTYALSVIHSLDGINDNLTLVGHSMAGLFIPLVANKCPIRKLVFLAAAIPKVGFGVLDRVLQGKESDMFSRDFPGDHNQFLQDENLAMKLLFHDCKPDITRWAISKLREQASNLVWTEITPLQFMPEVECAYIVCDQDRTINPEWARRAARELLGVEAIEFPGGHYPFLSHPMRLAEVLAEI